MPSLSTFPVIIPAAGIGSRMQAAVAKQYLRILGKTILEHTIDVFLRHPRISEIVVVLHPEDTLFGQLPIATHNKISRVIGGKERVDSVLKGLQSLPSKQQENWVLVHDAARPCLHQTDLDHLIESCTNTLGGILALPVADTIKQAVNLNANSSKTTLINKTVDRSQLWQAQTPQMFLAHQLIAAIEKQQKAKRSLTDEASAMELSGYPVQLIEGRSSNIKITRPSDLDLATFYLTSQEKQK